MTIRSIVAPTSLAYNHLSKLSKPKPSVPLYKLTTRLNTLVSCKRQPSPDELEHRKRESAQAGLLLTAFLLPLLLVNHPFPGEFWQILSLAADDVLDLFIQVETG